MKHASTILAGLAALALGVCACEKGPYDGDDFDNVVVYYGSGYNNLSSAIETNVKELCSGAIPDRKSRNALLAFCHTTATYGDYKTQHSPVLIRIYSGKKGVAVRDTVKVFSPTMISADEATINTVLSIAKQDYPAKHYGLVFSSHATGWLPPGYTKKDERQFSLKQSAERSVLPPGVYPTLPQNPDFPETKSIGAQFVDSSGSAYMMELVALSRAIPMKLDYIIFDACLMGCIEVAYELKDVCSQMIFSPTEIMKQGLMYPPMAGQLLRYPPLVEDVCKDYYNYYITDALTKAASIALIDCSKVEAVASDMAAIISAHADDIAALNRNSVQEYFYDEGSDTKHWFYDMRDIVAVAGASAEELSKLDADLAAMVKYKAATEYFFNLDIDPARFSGVSMYLPNKYWDKLNDYYKTLSWNKKVNLVK